VVVESIRGLVDERDAIAHCTVHRGGGVLPIVQPACQCPAARRGWAAGSRVNQAVPSVNSSQNLVTACFVVKRTSRRKQRVGRLGSGNGSARTPARDDLALTLGHGGHRPVVYSAGDIGFLAAGIPLCHAASATGCVAAGAVGPPSREHVDDHGAAAASRHVFLTLAMESERLAVERESPHGSPGPRGRRDHARRFTTTSHRLVEPCCICTLCAHQPDATVASRHLLLPHA
jgi:hypothetical protein